MDDLRLTMKYLAALLTAVLAGFAVPGAASAATGFTERIASARWLTSFPCPDGSTAANGRVLVQTHNYIEDGALPSPNPPMRVAFVGTCPTGTYSWGVARAAPTFFDLELGVAGLGGTFTNVRDSRGVPHTVSVEAAWTATGPIMTTINGPGSRRDERPATATARIVFDGVTLIDGVSNYPFPAPSMWIDTEE